MHEISIMEETFTIALEYAKKQEASQIHSFKMRIGAMSGVVPDALKFAFDVMIAGTMAENANLDIEIVPIICYCEQCKLEFSPPDLFYQCPQCGKLSYQIISGKEIELSSLEVS